MGEARSWPEVWCRLAILLRCRGVPEGFPDDLGLGVMRSRLSVSRSSRPIHSQFIAACSHAAVGELIRQQGEEMGEITIHQLVNQPELVNYNRRGVR